MVATPVAVAPFSLKDVSLIFGPDTGTSFEFNASVSEVTFTPTSSTTEWKGLNLNSFTDVTTATWTVTLAFAQDWDTAESLCAYLFDNEGLQTPVVFKPKLAGTPTFYGEVIITPGAIGGSVDAVAVATVTLGLAGKPSRTAPVVADTETIDTETTDTDTDTDTDTVDEPITYEPVSGAA